MSLGGAFNKILVLYGIQAGHKHIGGYPVGAFCKKGFPVGLEVKRFTPPIRLPDKPEGAKTDTLCCTVQLCALSVVERDPHIVERLIPHAVGPPELGILDEHLGKGRAP